MSSGGFYCSTSGTVFASKEEYMEHMKSDFHRYNLKRKVLNLFQEHHLKFGQVEKRRILQVAGLPPVTKDWFETRRAQLAGASFVDPGSKVWIDPLTRKKFMRCVEKREPSGDANGKAAAVQGWIIVGTTIILESSSST